MAAATASSSRTGKVYGFLDYSNILYMSQKNMGERNGFPTGISDICTKLVPIKVFDFLKQHHSSGQVRMEEKCT